MRNDRSWLEGEVLQDIGRQAQRYREIYYPKDKWRRVKDVVLEREASRDT